MDPTSVRVTSRLIDDYLITYRSTGQKLPIGRQLSQLSTTKIWPQMTCSYLCGSGIFMRVSHLVYIGHESLSHGSESLVPSSRFSRVLPRSAPALRFSRVLPRSSFGYLPSCVCRLLYIYASIFSSIEARVLSSEAKALKIIGAI